LIALIFNLTLLPALVLWLDKKKVRKLVSDEESAKNAGEFDH
jgi:hypothetical protein